jgi:ferrous iron transport protein B
MATRTIENRRDRLATILIAPFMTCSARLVVYPLLISVCFARWGALGQAGIMLACYAMGIVAAALTAWVFKRSLLKGGSSSFILELPSYKLPQVSQVARQVWTNSGQFITKAGTTILAFSIVLWALSYYPRLPAARQGQPTIAAQTGDDDNELTAKAAQSEYSWAGRLGHAMEPALRPLGFDWKMGVGLVGAFAARETFISTMAITYAVRSEDGKTQDLRQAMSADRYANGKPVWTPLATLSLLIWFVLALQCMSTVAIVRRETGGWTWPLFMILYMNVLAYVASLAVFQIGSHWLSA